MGYPLEKEDCKDINTYEFIMIHTGEKSTHQSPLETATVPTHYSKNDKQREKTSRLFPFSQKKYTSG